LLTTIDESSFLDLNNLDNNNNKDRNFTLLKNSNQSSSNKFQVSSTDIHYSPFIDNPEVLSTHSVLDDTHFNLALFSNYALDETPVNSFSKINTTILEDIYISLLYRLDKNNSVGIQFGRERFPQEFSKKDVKEWIQTTPVLTWIGAAYKFSASEYSIYDFIVPFGQIVAAYTPIGPLFRPQIGVQLYLYNFSFTLGGEYNILIYNVEGNLFTSQKIGFVYGLNYHF
jgi:hypothetical protein